MPRAIPPAAPPTLNPAGLAASAAPPAAPLRALWHDARGAWELAHKCVDLLEDADSMWVHAYLHRKEGDLSNARYWYRRAGREPFAGSLEEEWSVIAAALLARES